VQKWRAHEKHQGFSPQFQTLLSVAKQRNFSVRLKSQAFDGVLICQYMRSGKYQFFENSCFLRKSVNFLFNIYLLKVVGIRWVCFKNVLKPVAYILLLNFTNNQKWA